MIKINTDVIEDAIGRILEAIGEDRNRQGLVDTPKRVAKMYSEIFSGIGVDLDKQLQVTFDESYEDMVIVKDIPMQSIDDATGLPVFIGTVADIGKSCTVYGLLKAGEGEGDETKSDHSAFYGFVARRRINSADVCQFRSASLERNKRHRHTCKRQGLSACGG